MNKAIAVMTLAMMAATGFAVDYKWTGEESRDFEDPRNWLVSTDGGWVPAETAPANAYGVDDIYFDGDASSCTNMPLLTATNHIVHQVHFLTSGWTIDAAHVDPLDETSALCTLQVAKGYGGSGGGGVYKDTADEIGIIVDAGAVGGTNTITATIYQPGGLKVEVAANTTLELSGKLDINSTGTGLGGGCARMGFFGEGTLILSGADANSNLGGSFEMTSGLLVLAKDDNVAAVAVNGNGIDIRGGRVEILAEGQINHGKSTTSYYFSGNSTIDFGGHNANGHGGDYVFGAKASKSGVGAEWTGSITNTAKLSIPTGKSVIVNPTAAQVVFDGGLVGPRNWNGSDQWFKVADNPSLEEELVFNGPLFNNEANHKSYGSRVHLQGWTCDDVTSYGAITFNEGTKWSGAYSKLFVDTTVYNNATNELGGLGAPNEVTVSAPNGVLGGHGLVRTRAADVPVTVYGSIAPGSPAQRSGTLTVGVAEANVNVDFMTNSYFAVRVDANGELPKLNVFGGVSLQAVPDDAEEGVAAPTIVVRGAKAPRSGRHRVLTVNGTLDGEFAPTVVTDFPRSSRYVITPVYSRGEDGKTYVELKVGQLGTLFMIR